MSLTRIFIALLTGVTLLLFFGSRELRHNWNSPERLATIEQYTSEGAQVAAWMYAHLSRLTGGARSQLTRLQQQFAGGLDTLQNSLLSFSSVEFANAYYLDEALLRQLGQFDSQPSVFSGGLEKRVALLEGHPWIEQATIDWQILPLRLRVTLDEAEPWMVAEYSGHSWLLSRDRRLLSPLASLPNQELVELCSAKGRIDGLGDRPGVQNYLASENARLEYTTKMVSLLELARVFDYQIDRYTLEIDGSLIVTPAAPSTLPQVRLNVRSLPEAEQLREQLKAVLADLSGRGEQAREIDMRFQPQVIVR